MATAYLLENVSWTGISSDFKISLSLLPVPNIKAKTFHALTSNRTKLQKVTPRSLRVLYVHLMFTKKRKSTYKIIVSAWFSVWTSQGLNLGPPDYEFKELANGKEFSIDKKIPNFTFFGCKTGCKPCKSLIIRWYCGERGIRTPGASQHDGFQDRCNRPLYHLSFSI